MVPAARAARRLVLAAVVALVMAAPARAAVSFVSATSSANAGTTSSETITKPGGVASGSVLVATITAAGTGAITPPSGWTQIQDVTTTLRQTSYYHVATSSEPANYTWTLGSARLASGGIVAYSGVDGSVPVDASATASGSSGNASIPSVTTNVAGDTVLAAVGSAGTWSSNSIVPGASTTERYDISNAGTESEAADFAQATAGATPSKTATPATGGAWIAQAIALDPATSATLSLSSAASPTFTASLPAGDQAPTYTLPLTVQDTRTGGAAGWNITITSTQFSTGSSQTLAANASSVQAVSRACAGGASCLSPTNTITYPLTIPAGSTPPSAVKLTNAAAGTGTGIFTITPTIAVTVPANSYAGSYTSTLTIALVSGP